MKRLPFNIPSGVSAMLFVIITVVAVMSYLLPGCLRWTSLPEQNVDKTAIVIQNQIVSLELVVHGMPRLFAAFTLLLLALARVLGWLHDGARRWFGRVLPQSSHLSLQFGNLLFLPRVHRP